MIFALTVVGVFLALLQNRGQTSRLVVLILYAMEMLSPRVDKLLLIFYPLRKHAKKSTSKTFLVKLVLKLNILQCCSLNILGLKSLLSTSFLHHYYLHLSLYYLKFVKMTV